MKWSIRQRILVSYTVLVVLVAAVGLYAYSGLANIARQEADLKNSLLPSLSNITRIFATWEQNYALTQKLAAQQDSKASAAVTAALAENRKTLHDLLAKYEATGLAALDQDLFASLMVVQTSYYDQQDRLIELLRASAIREEGAAATPNDTARALLRLLDNNFDSLRRAAQGLVFARDYKAEKSIEESIAISTHAMRTLAIGLGVVLLAGVLSGFLLLRAVKRPLAGLVETMDKMRQGDFTQRISRQDEFGALGEGFNRMADELSGLFGQVQKSGIQVGSSVTQIAATAKQQQSTASEIAVTTTQIGATSKQISATAKELVRTMNDVSVVAEETAGVAASGQTGLARMEETMSHVMDAAGSINDKLGILNEKAGNINQVVTTITKVADQTNLLSLNAAIEAEKAGEYGRGFAVVASEIRRLADQTAVATYDIEQMVREIQSAVSAGVMGMDKFSDQVRRGMDDVREVGGQLTQIIRQVQALVPRIESANEGMHAQATGAEQITEALMQLTEAAQQTVESLRQSNSAIDDLNRVSSDLRSGVSRFKLDAAA